jgi:O-antigen/teichoic acid export membrane protein
MRIGQTSFTVFVSKIVGSGLGFVATIYIARELGAEILGYYSLVVVMVAWLKLAGHMGVSSAVTKRISEGRDQSEYFSAGVLLVGAVSVALSLAVILSRSAVQSYANADVAHFIVILLVLSLGYSIISSGLDGEHRVHISGVISTVNIGIRAAVQIGLVFLNFGLSGVIAGRAVGLFVASIIGSRFLSSRLVRPGREHVESLVRFAKFSWIGGLQNRSFNDVDILILGALVCPTSV